MEVTALARAQKVNQMLDYMVSEVVFNIKRVIINATGAEDKYAIAYKVLDKSFKVIISLHNIETRATVHKDYSPHEFARICSDKLLMESVFNQLAFDMLEEVDRQGQEIYL